MIRPQRRPRRLPRPPRTTAPGSSPRPSPVVLPPMRASIWRASTAWRVPLTPLGRALRPAAGPPDRQGRAPAAAGPPALRLRRRAARAAPGGRRQAGPQNRPRLRLQRQIAAPAAPAHRSGCQHGVPRGSAPRRIVLPGHTSACAHLPQYFCADSAIQLQSATHRTLSLFAPRIRWFSAPSRKPPGRFVTKG